MLDTEKDLRRKKVLEMHNSGSTPKEIIKATGLSRSGVYKILDTVLQKGEIAPKEPIVKVKLTGEEERFTSFVGYERTDVNQYAHKESGEIVNVVFVRAKKEGEFGYFVKVSDGSKKIEPQVVEEVDSTAELK